MSFLRPVMVRYPSASSRPRSPVANQPPRRTASVARGSLRYPEKMWLPCSQTSPSSAMCTVLPGIGRPTVPYLVAPGGFAVAAAHDSVSPYPSNTVIPAPSRNSPRRRDIADPPDMACRTRPPIASRTFP